VATTIISIFILAGEISMNADAFSYTGLTYTASVLVGIGVSVVTFMLGIMISYIIRRKDWKSKTKFWTAFVIVFLVSCLYYTLGSIRVAMLAADSDSGGLYNLSAFNFVVFNLAFFTAIFAAKFFIFPHPDVMKAIEEF